MVLSCKYRYNSLICCNKRVKMLQNGCFYVRLQQKILQKQRGGALKSAK